VPGVHFPCDFNGTLGSGSNKFQEGVGPSGLAGETCPLEVLTGSLRFSHVLCEYCTEWLRRVEFHCSGGLRECVQRSALGGVGISRAC
jgi:hypothetical protein